jgi:DNA gyrase subunit A
MTMLENGRYPKIYPWVAALRAHLDHEKIVYRRGFQFDLNKIEKRIHIINGLLIALASIDEVIKTIKTSTSTKEANENLQKNFLLDEAQAKAILDMKLARLAKLEVKKLTDEKDELEKEAERLKAILSDDYLLNKEIEKGLLAVIKKYGDSRRTQIMNIETEDSEPTEIRTLQLSLTNKNNIYLAETSTLYVQKRGGVGNKAKLEKGEFVTSSVQIESNNLVLLFSNLGNYYSVDVTKIPIEEKIAIESLININEKEKICAVTSLNKKTEKQNILFITKNGLVKKTLLSEYNTKRANGVKALNLDVEDEIISVLIANEEEIGILTERGNFVIITNKDIRPIGRIARGVIGIKLNEDDYVIQARLIPKETKEILSISGEGYIKRTSIKEFNVQTKNTKGSKIQKLGDEDWAADFYPLINEKEILINTTASCIKIEIISVPLVSKVAQGVKSIKMGIKDNIISLS